MLASVTPAAGLAEPFDPTAGASLPRDARDAFGEDAAAPVRVFLVDRHDIVRRGLRRILDEDGRFSIVGEAATAADALRAVGRAQPDVCVIDERLADGSGIGLCRDIAAASPHTRSIVLTANPSQNAVIDAIRAGAAGILLQDVSVRSLVDAITAVSNGDCMLDPAVTGWVLDYFRRRVGAPCSRYDLTETELQLVAFISRGMSNRQMAEHLGLPNATVKGRVSALLRKLEMTSRTQIALYGAQLPSLADGPDDGR